MFFLSSFLMGGSLLSYLFIPMTSKSPREALFCCLLFLVSIFKVYGIHLKYGLFLGADAFAEYTGIIRVGYTTGFIDMNVSALAQFPLSMFSTVITSLFVGQDPIHGPWNVIHLVSNALIPVLIYLIARQVFHKNLAILASFMVAYHPTNTILGLSMTRENLALLFLMFAVYFTLTQLRRPRALVPVVYLVFVAAILYSHAAISYLALAVTLLLYFVARFAYGPGRAIPEFYGFALFILLYFRIFWTANLYYELRAGYAMTTAVLDFLSLQSPLLQEPAHHEVRTVLTDFSLTPTLFKVQALTTALGSLWFGVHFLLGKLTREQIVLAAIAIVMTILAGFWTLIPSLGDMFFPHRVLRYSGLLASFAGAFFIVNSFGMTDADGKGRNLLKGVLLVGLLTFIFIYPITQVLSNNMAFSRDSYPSQLYDEMYNIRSMREVDLLGLVDRVVPKGASIVLEFPMRNALAHFYRGAGGLTYLTEGNALDPPRESFLLLRKSLFSNGEYIHYPEGEDIITYAPQARSLSGANFASLTGTLERNNLIYSDPGYRILHSR